MRRQLWRLYIGLLFATGCLAQSANAPGPLTWQEIQDRFRTNNPTLLPGKVTIDEAQADEITAYLRPNPNLTIGLDQLTPFNGNPYRPLSESYLFWDIDYLHK